MSTTPPSLTRSHPHALTEAERDAYRKDGFFARERVFSAEDVEEMCRAAERVVARAAEAAAGRSSDAYHYDGNRYVDADGSTVQYEHREGSQTIRVIEPFHHLDPVFDRLMGDPRLVAPACGILGTDRVSLWTDKINLKRPREGSRFRWHQDSPYWGHVHDDCDSLPNVMITLDDASETNGCFRVIRGSHVRGFLPGIADDSQLGPLFTDPAAFDESEQWLAEVPAGSIVFFSAHTVHGSLPNESDLPRRAMVLSYQHPDRPMFRVEGTRTFGLGA